MLVAAVAMLLVICSTVAASAQDDLEDAEERAMRAAVQRVAKSVVRIETIGGLEVVGGQLANTGPTTGLIVGEDGWVLSSAFNFAQQPTSILVTLPGGKRAAAEIAARDAVLDELSQAIGELAHFMVEFLDAFLRFLAAFPEDSIRFPELLGSFLKFAIGFPELLCVLFLRLGHFAEDGPDVFGGCSSHDAAPVC